MGFYDIYDTIYHFLYPQTSHQTAHKAVLMRGQSVIFFYLVAREIIPQLFLKPNLSTVLGIHNELLRASFIEVTKQVPRL